MVRPGLQAAPRLGSALTREPSCPGRSYCNLDLVQHGCADEWAGQLGNMARASQAEVQPGVQPEGFT